MSASSESRRAIKVSKKSGKVLVDWDQVINEVSTSIQWFKSQGVKPTLRSMFYRLYSLGIIGNTENIYKGLVKQCVHARKDGRLPIDCFADKRRDSSDGESKYESPMDKIRLYYRIVAEAGRIYMQTFPRWYKQPEYVEI